MDRTHVQFNLVEPTINIIRKRKYHDILKIKKIILNWESIKLRQSKYTNTQENTCQCKKST